MTTDPQGRVLPRGVTFERPRGRYRVRLYRRSREIWLSYTDSYEQAMRDFEAAKAKQQRIRKAERVVRGTAGYAAAIANELI